MEFKSGQLSFNQDIKTGEEGEAFIRSILEGLGFVYVNNCKDIDYDLKMAYKGKQYTYEIKTDTYPKDTGNLVIEFECRGKASGINATKADYFTYFFPKFGEIWNIKCEDLRRLIAQTNPAIFSNAGDKGSGTKLYRLVKKDVRTWFKIHQVSVV